jgi:nitric oxide dioxygenase
MTPTDIANVKRTFAMVAPIADRAGLMFYEKLFALDPTLRPMFADDITEQSKKLMHVLAVAANGIDRLDTLVPIVQALGVRHVDYKVKDEHYDTVGTALISTLQAGLADEFTPEVKSAWLNAMLLSGIMKDAAHKASTAQV